MSGLDYGERLLLGLLVVVVLMGIFATGALHGKSLVKEFYERECLLGHTITPNGTEFTCERVDDFD